MPATPPPRAGAIFLDARSDRRALRVTWHPERDVVVLSLWRDNVCAATFRLRCEDVADLVAALGTGPAGEPADGPAESILRRA